MKKYVMMVIMLMFTLSLGACANTHDNADGATMKHTGKNAHDRSFDIIR